MDKDNVRLEYTPELNEALFIAGFDGWGNALDVSRGMIDYMIRKLEAKPFGRINPDHFYSYDKSRPQVEIENGLLKSLDPPGGLFYTVSEHQTGRDLIFLKATEPNLRWFQFTETILSLCKAVGVKTIISLGSMYDNVLHTDTVISAISSSEKLRASLEAKKIAAIDYKGPSAIHSTLFSEAGKHGFECLSIWCHCPYYLQGTTHFGLLSHLGSFLSSWGGFNLDTDELTVIWKDLNKQIQGIIDKNPELQGMIRDLRKTKVKVSWDTAKKRDKIIQFEDFLKSK